jgi:uncharacterized DUF497 family protein
MARARLDWRTLDSGWFAEKEPDVVRIISLRKATRHERKNFEEAIHDGLEAS